VTSSTLASKYEASYSRLAERLLKHPNMYAREVSRLESMFFGHWAAFWDMDETLERTVFFSEQFCIFLEQRHGLKEFALGWSHVLLQHSGWDEAAAKELFLTYLGEFIDAKKAGEGFPLR
jgi:hypothetical protein